MKKMFDSIILGAFYALAYPAFRLMEWLDRPKKARAELFAQAEKLRRAQAARDEDLRKAYARRREILTPSQLEFQEARKARKVDHA